MIRRREFLKATGVAALTAGLPCFSRAADNTGVYDIEKFGIWFGKPIWKKKINGVEYSLGCIPAGGFVALPQLAPMEVMEGKVETPRKHNPERY